MLVVNQYLTSRILLQCSIIYRHQNERGKNLYNAWHVMLKSTKKNRGFDSR